MFEIKGDKACINVFTLIHDFVPDDRKQELAESLTCSDFIIKSVLDQVLDGWTENGFHGGETCTTNPESFSPLQKARRRVAEGANETARKEIKRLQRQLDFEKGEAAPTKPEDINIQGYAFLSPDDKKIVQYELNGFTFNWLNPYSTWEEMRDEAKPLWNIYTEFAKPEYITRVALRYINRLELPLPIKDFADYLTSPPTVPEAIPQALSSFLTRAVTHEPISGLNAIITQALETIVKPDIMPIILDIDVFKEGQLDIDSQDAWDILEQLRIFKNTIFFESITEKAVEVFK